FLCCVTRPPPALTLFPSTTLFRSERVGRLASALETRLARQERDADDSEEVQPHQDDEDAGDHGRLLLPCPEQPAHRRRARPQRQDRKSTRLNSSHVKISYAVFCLK